MNIFLTQRILHISLMLCFAVVLGGSLYSCTSSKSSMVYKYAKEGNLNQLDKEFVSGTNINYPNSKQNSPLYLAVQNDQKSTILFLLERGADPNFKKLDSDSPFKLAVEKGDLQIIYSFIQFNANVNEKNLSGWTPLMSAAQDGNLEVTKLLIRYGARVMEKTSSGITALWLAKKSKNRDLVAYLEQKERSEKKKKALELKRTELLQRRNPR